MTLVPPRESSSHAASVDLMSIFDSVDLPMVVVSQTLTVAGFNRAATGVIGIVPSDIGQSARNVRMLSGIKGLEQLYAQVVAEGSSRRCEIQEGDRWFSVQIGAYTDSDGNIAGAVLTFTNITISRVSIQQAIYEREYTKTILNTISEPLLVLDSELRVQTANRAFYGGFGLSRDHAQGVPLSDLWKGEGKFSDVWASLKAMCSDNAEFQAREVDCDLPLHGRRTMLFNALRVCKEGPPLALILLQDVTERKRVELLLREREKRLREFAEELERQVATRTAELSQSQQQLRALTAQLNLTEQKERRRLAGELHDYLGQMLALSRIKIDLAKKHSMEASLARLLDEVQATTDKALTYTRSLVAQLSPPVLQEFGLAMALPWLAEQMLERDLVVTLDLRTPIPPIPEDQALLIFQSIRELLLNCIKHAHVSRAMVVLERKDGALHITVSDNGTGFDPSDLAVTKATGSLPKYGLFSIRERMISLGGHFDVESAVGKGTIATLVFPICTVFELPVSLETLSPRKDEANTAKDPKMHSCAAGTVHLLIADDHVMVRQGLCGLLSAYKEIQIVGEASNGKEAVELAHRLQPDIILMDVTMPDIDGIEVTRRIKSDCPHILVVGMSVHSAEQVERAMIDAGAVAFINKEAAVEELHRTILAVQRSRVKKK